MIKSVLFRPVRLLASLALVAGSLLFLGACQTNNPTVGAELPLSEEPLLGKFVWHDLVTDDVAGARKFYAGLFGWTFEEDMRLGEGYTLISSGGFYIGGMVETRDVDDKDFTRWLGYLSVPNVDEAARTTSDAGGEVVVAPLDINERVRAAAIRDPQGAVLGLVRSEEGDPDDSYDPGQGHAVWNELLAADDKAAGQFYAALAGLDPVTTERRGGEYIMLKAAGRERAGVMRRPNEAIEPLWLTYFAVSDPSEAARRVESLGGEVLLAPSPELREGTVALVVDPQGAVLALQKWPL